MSLKVIGLTGGIGSGKTFVASIFAQMGIPVYDSDSLAKNLMITDDDLVTEIKKLFGKTAYLKDGALNRSFISEKIFNDQDLREELNALVHPAVRKDFKKWSKKQIGVPYVINEAALFIENDSYTSFDSLITVVCPMELRIKRIRKRSQISKENILKIINSQSSDEEKMAKSNFTIYNDQLNTLFQQITIIHKILVYQ